MLHVDMSMNEITVMPPELGSLGTLVSLKLAHNSIRGPLPPQAFTLPELKLLDVSQ